MPTTKKDTQVTTGIVRLSFVHLLEPHAQEEGQDKKYSCMLLIPKSDKTTLSKIKKAIEAAKIAGKDKLKGIKDPKITLRDGDEEQDIEERPEFEDQYFMNVSCKSKPGIIDREMNPLYDPERIYSGVYARVSINFYAYNSHGNKGISAGLNNVQIIKDGDYLGGRTSPDADFDVYELEDEDDDLGLL